MSALGEQKICSLSTSVRHRERRALISLKRDFLRQHDIADRKAPLRPEAPDGDLRTVLVELVNVHLMTAGMR